MSPRINPKKQQGRGNIRNFAPEKNRYKYIIIYIQSQPSHFIHIIKNKETVYYKKNGNDIEHQATEAANVDDRRNHHPGDDGKHPDQGTDPGTVENIKGRCQPIHGKRPGQKRIL